MPFFTEDLTKASLRYLLQGGSHSEGEVIALAMSREMADQARQNNQEAEIQARIDTAVREALEKQATAHEAVLSSMQRPFIQDQILGPDVDPVQPPRVGPPTPRRNGRFNPAPTT